MPLRKLSLRKGIQNKLISIPVQNGCKNYSKFRDLSAGVYHLLLFLHRSRKILVGSLGLVDFPSGYYIYTGRARRGMSHRLIRHLKKRKNRHWHIDYLTKVAEIREVLINGSEPLAECSQHQTIMKLQVARVIISRFGSSDCRCHSHLAFFQTKPKLSSMKNRNLNILKASDRILSHDPIQYY